MRGAIAAMVRADAKAKAKQQTMPEKSASMPQVVCCSVLRRISWKARWPKLKRQKSPVGMMGLFLNFIFCVSKSMKVEKKYTHRVVVILLMIGVIGRTIYGAIRAAWKPIQEATSCEYMSEMYLHDFDFFQKKQPPIWDILFQLPQYFLLALVLAIPIYVSYLISRKFSMASFVFKIYIFWYVLVAYGLVFDGKPIADDNCRMGSEYIGFFVMDLLACFIVPIVVVFLIFVEAFVLVMEKRSLMAQKEKSEAKSDS
jgi:hypothetical protein